MNGKVIFVFSLIVLFLIAIWYGTQHIEEWNRDFDKKWNAMNEPATPATVKSAAAEALLRPLPNPPSVAIGGKPVMLN